MSNDIVKQDEGVKGFLVAHSFQDAVQISQLLSKTQMIPKQYTGKPDDILVAMAMGAELGFQPLQSLQNIAVINGRPSVWGDAFRALIISAPDLISFEEGYDESTSTAWCKITRRLPSGNDAVFNGSFSMEDARIAGLANKTGPWQTYPKRQQQWRALGFAGRDAYADRLRGVWIAAEAEDKPKDYTQAKDVTPQQNSAASVLNSVIENQPEVQEKAVNADPVNAENKVGSIIDIPAQETGEISPAIDSLIEQICETKTVEALNAIGIKINEGKAAGNFTKSEHITLGNAYRSQRESIRAGMAG